MYPAGMDPIAGLAKVREIFARQNIGELTLHRRSQGAIVSGNLNQLLAFRVSLDGFETSLLDGP
jgi:hypothetical protein